MGNGEVRFDLVLGVLAITTLIAGTAVGVGIIAFRKKHALIDRCEAMLRRFGAAEQDDQAHSARARMNLIVLSAFLLWVAFLLCLGGLRAVLVTG
jgi:hypothetical protein